MTPVIPILLFGFGVATVIVPTGAQLVGRLIELFGMALQRHGEALSAAFAEYRRTISGDELTHGEAVTPPSGQGERSQGADLVFASLPQATGESIQ